MTSTVRFNVDQLIEVPAQAAAVHEILKGTFDEEIAKIKALRDELAQRQAVDDTFEKAKAAHADATMKQSMAMATLAEAKASSQKMSDEARALQTLAQSNMKLVDEKAAKLETARVVFEAERNNASDLLDQRTAALDLRESQLAAMAAKLGEEQRAFAVEKEAFNKKLESLKA